MQINPRSCHDETKHHYNKPWDESFPKLHSPIFALIAPGRVTASRLQERRRTSQADIGSGKATRLAAKASGRNVAPFDCATKNNRVQSFAVVLATAVRGHLPLGRATRPSCAACLRSSTTCMFSCAARDTIVGVVEAECGIASNEAKHESTAVPAVRLHPVSLSWGWTCGAVTNRGLVVLGTPISHPHFVAAWSGAANEDREGTFAPAPVAS